MIAEQNVVLLLFVFIDGCHSYPADHLHRNWVVPRKTDFDQALHWELGSDLQGRLLADPVDFAGQEEGSLQEEIESSEGNHLVEEMEDH